jgi:hypothetical protein
MNNKQKQPRTEPTLDPMLAQYAPKKDKPLAEFNEAVEKIIEDINDEQPPPPPPSRPQPEFVTLAERCAEALVQSAEAALIQAQNNLAQARIYADELRTEVAKHRERNDTITDRLSAFGNRVLAAHQEFHS